MSLLFTNNASTTLADALNAGATQAVLATNGGALFPNPTGGDTFYATLEDAAGNIEIISCSGRSSDTLTTIVRAQEGTSDQTWAIGTRIEIRATAATLDAFLQAADATGLYAPLTHFNDSGTTAQLLENGAVAAETTNQGLRVQRAAGQTQTTITYRDGGGTALGSVYHSSGNDLIVSNAVNSGWVKLWGEDSGGAPTSLVEGDPDGYVSLWYQGNIKTETDSHGLQVWGENASAPYNSHISLHSSGGTEVGRVGMVPGANEMRLESDGNGYAFRLRGKDTGGDQQTVLLGDPDGTVNLYHAGAKKFETASGGVAIFGVATQDTSPSAADHLTTKQYVDAQIQTDLSAGTGLVSQAGTAGHVEVPGGLMFQWGQTGSSGSGSIVVSFSRNFGATAYNVQICERTAGAGDKEHRHAAINVSASGFTISKESDYSMAYYWFAVGLA
jgi:hypothetical protein